ncbi:MAG: hypothetical protein HYY51_03735 [Candidatus Magasanikbacteria bacterium]|nr:hypothetical protein [Candidatus Magasanikbacteria bacterium]
MDELDHSSVKQALLKHVREIFEEIESELARSHEERYALLEDSLENASDGEELRVAFEQWYADHAEDMSLDYGLEEIWDNAVHAAASSGEEY